MEFKCYLRFLKPKKLRGLIKVSKTFHENVFFACRFRFLDVKRMLIYER